MRLALGRVLTYGRLYRFEFLPLGFFGRVAVGVRRREEGEREEKREKRRERR
jgi:hypothetical protein